MGTCVVCCDILWKIYIVLRGVIFCYIELYRSAEYYDAYEIYYGMLRVLEDNRSMNLSF